MFIDIVEVHFFVLYLTLCSALYKSISQKYHLLHSTQTHTSHSYTSSMAVVLNPRSEARCRSVVLARPDCGHRSYAPRTAPSCMHASACVHPASTLHPCVRVCMHAA